MSKAEKIISIQYLRGLAALAVVFCHLGYGLSNYPALLSAFSWGQMGVLVFFFISGFIIVYSLQKSEYRTGQFFTFLIKRSIRIDPPYWAMLILYIALGYFMHRLSAFNTFNFSLPQLIAHLFYAIPFTRYPFYDHVFWTLCVEFQFYILIGLLYFLSDNKIYRAIFLIIFGLANLYHFNSEGIIFNYSAVFAFGIAFMAFYLNQTKLNALLPAFLICLIAFCHGWGAVILLLITCAVVMLVKFRFKPLYFLGNISYSLYLTHTFVAGICYIIFKRLAIAPYQLLCFGIALTAAILFAWVFYLVIEKPFIGLSKKFSYKRRG